MANNRARAARWGAVVRDQRDWIAERGGSERGYVECYGSWTQTVAEGRYGDGGEAIYAADMAALKHAEAHLAVALGNDRLAETNREEARDFTFRARNLGKLTGMTDSAAKAGA